MRECWIEGEGPAGAVPGRLYVPDGDAKGVLLLGHGGLGGKDLPRFVDLARRYAEGTGLAVLCIDGPAHGERAPNTGSADEDFRLQRMKVAAKGTSEQMVADWQGAVSAADVGPALAYAGFSMGFSFGVPTVAAIRTVRAAVLGLAGYAKPGALANFIGTIAGEDKRAAAAKIYAEDARAAIVRECVGQLDHCEVLMLNARHDEIFTLEGAIEFFDAIPGGKRLVLWPGGHTSMNDEGIDLSISFVRQVVFGKTRSGVAEAW